MAGPHVGVVAPSDRPPRARARHRRHEDALESTANPRGQRGRRPAAACLDRDPQLQRLGMAGWTSRRDQRRGRRHADALGGSATPLVTGTDGDPFYPPRPPPRRFARRRRRPRPLPGLQHRARPTNILDPHPTPTRTVTRPARPPDPHLDADADFDTHADRSSPRRTRRHGPGLPARRSRLTRPRQLRLPNPVVVRLTISGECGERPTLQGPTLGGTRRMNFTGRLRRKHLDHGLRLDRRRRRPEHVRQRQPLPPTC
jgi:hypothetical protein